VLLIAVALVYTSYRSPGDSMPTNSPESTAGTTQFLAQAQESNEDDQALSATDTRQIVPSDRLAVVVEGEPNLSKTVAVAEDGTISIPLAETIAASGKSIQELAGDLQKALATFIRAPEVSVAIETSSRCSPFT
jgi:protein involved in polysaccharide export with SLBB domain